MSSYPVPSAWADQAALGSPPACLLLLLSRWGCERVGTADRVAMTLEPQAGIGGAAVLEQASMPAPVCGLCVPVPLVCVCV